MLDLDEKHPKWEWASRYLLVKETALYAIYKDTAKKQLLFCRKEPFEIQYSFDLDDFQKALENSEHERPLKILICENIKDGIAEAFEWRTKGYRVEVFKDGQRMMGIS